MTATGNPYDILINPRLDGALLADLNKRVENLDWRMESPGARPMPPAEPDRQLLRTIGQKLWEAAGLDAAGICDMLEDARGDDECLRLLVQGPDHYHLPWELLYHEHVDIGFIGLNPRCVIARWVNGKVQKKPTPAPKPFRILLFVSSPDDLDQERGRLSYELEEERLFTALDQPYSRGEIEIDVAPDGFLSTLVDTLSWNRYHAAILSLHGAKAVNRQGLEEWGLLFENEKTWNSRPVAGSDLAEALGAIPKGRRPGLIMLGACRSARAEASDQSIIDVARHLHREGMERVLGMRLSVIDMAASAFNAAFFTKLAQGETVGRAVSLARKTLNTGSWLEGKMGDVKEDPFFQWTLPVLLDRTTDGPVVDLEAPVQTIPRPPIPDALPGDGTVPLPSRSAFVGRRGDIRQSLMGFLSGTNQRLLFTGPGGVGKTSLAGLFARILKEQNPNMLVFGFRAPFHLDAIYEPIRQAAFDGKQDIALHDQIQKEPDQRERLRLMLLALANRDTSCAFVLDNLESLQDIETLNPKPEHEDSRWFVNTICRLPFPTRVLMTGRYTLENLLDTKVQAHPLGMPLYGDILHRMRRLSWPESMDLKTKRWIYEVLGGNHRAMEWMAQLLTHEKVNAEALLKTLETVDAPAQTPEQAVATVTEAMRQNMLFDELRSQLSPTEDKRLRMASLYRIPVHRDGLAILQPDTKAEDLEKIRKRLLDYALFEPVKERSLDLTYYTVPPIVREFIGDPDIKSPELEDIHWKMGKYHRFQGQYVSRQWSDDLEAIYHFRQAGAHKEADELAEPVSAFYYNDSNYAETSDLLSEIVARPAPPPPWWALNRFGQCQHHLGYFKKALQAFERAREACPDRKEEGTTLNNISQIYKARGDYENALKFLDMSRRIREEIGDKAGLISTLHNMAHIAQQDKEPQKAVELWSEALNLAMENGNAEGIFHVARDFGQLLAQAGEKQEAQKLLALSLKVGKAAGFPDVEEVDKILNEL